MNIKTIKDRLLSSIELVKEIYSTTLQQNVNSVLEELDKMDEAFFTYHNEIHELQMDDFNKGNLELNADITYFKRELSTVVYLLKTLTTGNYMHDRADIGRLLYKMEKNLDNIEKRIKEKTKLKN